MARKARRINPLIVLPEPVAQQKLYRVDGYVRLSVEDSGKGTSDSIESQKAMILDYIESQPDMELSALYCDNGETGTNFDRPGFEHMMEDLKSGKADCVVVKDLSRFGRNYIETGNYLERVFPFLGVRFVAITDQFDTVSAQRSEDGYIIPLKNLINHIYAKDISRKSGSAIAAKQKKGEFIGARAAYGYRKDPNDKNHLLVDEEAAAVVRNIFRWYADGVGVKEIVRKLEQDGIPSPGQRLVTHGLAKSKRFSTSHWNDKTIKDMLQREVYLGHTVQGQVRESLFEGLPKTKLPRDEWIVVRDTHEPIISDTLFEAAQSVLHQNKESYLKKRERLSAAEGTENLLKGLIFCGDCGKGLCRHKVVRVNKLALPQYHVWYQYICPCHTANSTKCRFTSVREKDILQAILSILQVQIASMLDLKEMLVKLQNRPDFRSQKNACQTEKIRLERQLSDTMKYRKGLFENYYAKVITEQEYLFLSESYEKETEALKKQLCDCVQTEESTLDRYDPHGTWISTFEQFSQVTELTREMVLALVEKVTVAPDKTLSITLKYRDEYNEICSAMTQQAVSACG